MLLTFLFILAIPEKIKDENDRRETALEIGEARKLTSAVQRWFSHKRRL